MTDLENLYRRTIQRVRLHPCCFSGAKRDYPVFALYPPEYQCYSHQIAACGGWYRGTDMRLAWTGAATSTVSIAAAKCASTNTQMKAAPRWPKARKNF